ILDKEHIIKKIILLSILKNTSLEYIKHNRVRLKEGSQKKVTEIFKEFFENIKGTVKGLKGYAILENIENDRETIVLTFWENREDMENYYSKDNKILSDLVEKVKPMFEQMPERSDYKIALFEID
ncbi:MAG TPA: antibiotic biosynthesis monooxygenase family protein, partial [Nitrososphaeraceae archaeon]|nr:antibiotic biosynthesis monooxygenase family protein [Nitrososphaeraceae archaeon]